MVGQVAWLQCIVGHFMCVVLSLCGSILSPSNHLQLKNSITLPPLANQSCAHQTRVWSAVGIPLALTALYRSTALKHIRVECCNLVLNRSR